MTFASYIDKFTDLILPNETLYPVMTCVLEMPRCLLAQFNTYGCMVRSVASSRAIPHATFRSMAKARYYWDRVPLYAHQKGMATDTLLSPEESTEARKLFKESFNTALETHEKMEMVGVCKGQANRILEPYMTVDVIATASMEQWEHIFEQRLYGSDAQKEWGMVLQPIADQLKTVKRVQRKYHIPMITDDEEDAMPMHLKIIKSIKRCASASYGRHGAQFNLRESAKTVKHCIAKKHASTYEHQWFVSEDGKEWSRTKHQKVQPIRNMPSIMNAIINETNNIITGEVA